MTVIINGQPAALSRTEIDTISELEAFLGSVNLILASEIDSEAKIEALAGAINLLVSTELDTEAELETLLGAVNVILASEINSEAKVEAIMGVAMATEAEAAAAASSAVGTHAALASPHSDIGLNTAARHTQGTDLGLDTGGANAVTAAQAKAASDHVGASGASHADVATNTAARHTQGTDQGLDTGGANAVTVAAVKGAVDEVGAKTLIDTTDARLSDARTPTAHQILGAPHGITGLTQGYAPVAGGAGALVSSSGQSLKAFTLESASHVYIASGTGGVYNDLENAGLGAGMLLLHPTGKVGVLKIVNGKATEGAGNIATAICYDANLAAIDDEMIINSIGWTNNAGPPRVYNPRLEVMDLSLFIPSETTANLPAAADHTNEIAVATDGESGEAPTIVICDGAAWNRVAVQDWTTILDDTFDQSRNDAALVAAGYVIHDGGTDGPAGSTITESGTELTVETPDGVSSEWYGGTYTACRLSYALGTRGEFPADEYLLLASVDHDAGPGNPARLTVTEGADANFVSADRRENAGSNVAYALRGTGTIVSGPTTTASTTGWMALWINRGRIALFGWTTTAVGTVPDMSDITWMLSYPMTDWGPDDLVAHLMSARTDASTSTQKFYRLVIRARGA